jgi:hypothetical protein
LGDGTGTNGWTFSPGLWHQPGPNVSPDVGPGLWFQPGRIDGHLAPVGCCFPPIAGTGTKWCTLGPGWWHQPGPNVSPDVGPGLWFQPGLIDGHLAPVRCCFPPIATNRDRMVHFWSRLVTPTGTKGLATSWSRFVAPTGTKSAPFGPGWALKPGQICHEHIYSHLLPPLSEPSTERSSVHGGNRF